MLQKRHQVWRSEAGSRRWLATLVAAMDDAARPELRRQPVAATTLQQFRAQLALPASSRLYRSPASSLRH